MSNAIKCIILQSWTRTNPAKGIYEAHTAYVTNEDGTPTIYDSLTEARAEISANGYRIGNRDRAHDPETTDIDGTRHESWIYIIREDTDEYAEAIAEAEAERIARQHVVKYISREGAEELHSLRFDKAWSWYELAQRYGITEHQARKAYNIIHNGATRIYEYDTEAERIAAAEAIAAEAMEEAAEAERQTIAAAIEYDAETAAAHAAKAEEAARKAEEAAAKAGTDTAAEYAAHARRDADRATETAEANAAELEQRAEILAAIEAPALREYFTAEATAHQWTPEETRNAIEHRASIIKANAAALAFLDAYADASGDTLTEDDDETHAAYMVARDEITGTSARATDHDRALVAGMTQTIADAVAYMQPLAVASATADRFCEAYDDATGNLTAAAYDAAQAVARAEIAGGHATGTDYAWTSQMVEAIAADAAHRAALAGYADIPWLVWPEDDDPRSREPYQRYELEAFLGEPDDYDVDAIEAEATAYDPKTGRTVWAQGIDLAAIAERHQVATA